MVQASTLVIAAFAVAPVLAAPLNVHSHTAGAHRAHERPAAPAHRHRFQPGQLTSTQKHPRDIDGLEILDARDPFSFKKAFKKIGRVAKKVGGVALKAAPLLLRDVDESDLELRDVIGAEGGASAQLFIRDEDGSLFVREVSLEEFDLDARDPFSFKKAFKKIGSVAKKAGGIAIKAAPLLLRDVNLEEGAGSGVQLVVRDEDGDVYVREISADELLELDARDPFSLRKTIRKVGGVAKKAVGVVNTVSNAAHALGLRELEDGADLEVLERELDDAAELDILERDLDDFEGLDARDPKFNLGGFVKKAKGTVNKVRHTASNVLRTVDKVSAGAHRLGLRELEEMEERSIDELD